MINQVKQTLQEGLAAVVASSAERHPPLAHPTPAHLPIPPPPVQHPPPMVDPPQPQRKSRSLHRGARSPAIDKSAMSRTRSPRRDRRHRGYLSESPRSPASLEGRRSRRERPLKLRSATASRRSTSVHSVRHEDYRDRRGDRTPEPYPPHSDRDDSWTRPTYQSRYSNSHNIPIQVGS